MAGMGIQAARAMIRQGDEKSKQAGQTIVAAAELAADVRAAATHVLTGSGDSDVRQASDLLTEALREAELVQRRLTEAVARSGRYLNALG